MTETIQIKVPKWNIESETGYKPRTTFWQDFSIADAFGGDAVTDTFLVRSMNGKTIVFTLLSL